MLYSRILTAAELAGCRARFFNRTVEYLVRLLELLIRCRSDRVDGLSLCTAENEFFLIPGLNFARFLGADARHVPESM